MECRPGSDRAGGGGDPGKSCRRGVAAVKGCKEVLLLINERDSSSAKMEMMMLFGGLRYPNISICILVELHSIIKYDLQTL